MQSAERTRARLMRRVLFFETCQDVLFFLSAVCHAPGNLFNNLANTCKMAEVDAAKQYRALTGSAVREIDDALLGARSEDS